MNHKRKRPKRARAGCLMCKPHKSTGIGELRSAKISDKKRLIATKEQLNVNVKT